MKLTSKLFLPFIILFFGFSAVAQDDFIEVKDKITSTVLRSDKKQLIFTTSKYMYLVDVDSFKITDSIKLHQRVNYKAKGLEYVASNNNIVLVTNMEYSKYGLPRCSQEFNEYPQDSTFFYNIKNKILLPNRFPGNTYVTFSNDSLGNYVFGYNNFQEYRDDSGYIHRGSRKGELSYYPDKIRVPSTGILKKLKISPSNKEVAVLNYDSFSDGKYQYTLELRNLPNLALIKSVTFTGKPKKIVFSTNNKYLAIIKDDSPTVYFRTESVDFYSTKNLELLTIIPDDLIIDGLIADKKVWKMMKGSVVNYNLITEKNDTEIWANLTPMSNIEGFYKINNDEIILYGGGSSITGAKAGIYKYSLKDNAIYSKVEYIVAQDSLFNPKKILIQNNTFSGETVQLNKSKTILLASNDNTMQIWSVFDKRKIYDIKFKNAIRPFISEDGNTCLIFEEYVRKNYNEFMLKSLDLSTGIVKSALVDEDTGFSMSSVKCFNIEAESDKWICSDKGAKLWEIDAKELEIKSIYNVKDKKYYNTSITNISRLSDSNSFLFNSISTNIDTHYNVTETYVDKAHIYNYNTKISESIDELNSDKQFIPISKEEVIYKKANTLEVLNIQNKSKLKIKSIRNRNITNVLLSDSNAYILLSDENELLDSLDVIQYDVASKKAVFQFKLPIYSKGHFATKEGISYSDSDNYFTYAPKLNQAVPWRNSNNLFTQQNDLSISNEGYLLFRNEWLINLKTLEIEKQFQSFHQPVLFRETKKLLFIDSKTYGEKLPYFQYKVSNINSVDQPIWQSEKFKLKDHYSAPDKIQLSKNGKYAISYNSRSYDQNNEFYFIDVENGKVSKEKNSFKISNAFFTSNDTKLVFISNKNTYPNEVSSQIYDVRTLELENKIQLEVEQILTNQKVLYLDSKSVVLSDVENGKLINRKDFYARTRLYKALYLEQKKIIVAGNDSGDLFFWKEENQSPLKKIHVNSSKVLSFTEVDDKLYVLYENSEIKIINLNTLELDITCTFYKKEDGISMAWFTSEGYFKASKNDIRNFHFVKDAKVFPLLNYELFLNRPDIIMQKIGFAKKDVIQVYKEAYVKRLKRNNYNENTDFLSIKKHKIQLLNRNQIPSVVGSDKLKLDIKTSSGVSELLIYINGVPVTKRLVSSTAAFSEEITLSDKLNAITILGKDDKGLESDPITFEITNTKEKSKSHIYYVGIGVSKYKDSSMNLRYADKDVRSLTKVFKQKFEGRISIDTLTNELVTKENILAIKTKLEQTNINDIVIISFSGHGLIDQKSNFYFATHDIDFDAPELRGFSYDKIQNLLSNIPARKKLLLLDACQSGEIDNEIDLEIVALEDPNIKQYIPEGAKGSIVVKNKKKKGLKQSFELMKSLFYDLDRGNGSFVISAAGGREYAYENEKWKNGVFTYSFINAINDLSYDTWKGEQGVKISKLKEYVYKSVKKLTKNQQKPTSRAENIEWDWLLK